MKEKEKLFKLVRGYLGKGAYQYRTCTSYFHKPGERYRMIAGIRFEIPDDDTGFFYICFTYERDGFYILVNFPSTRRFIDRSWDNFDEAIDLFNAILLEDHGVTLDALREIWSDQR